MPVEVSFGRRGNWEGYANQLKALRSLPNVVAGVAVPDTAHPDKRASGATTLDIAMWQEQGFRHRSGTWVPPRPVFGPTMDDNAPLYFRSVKRAVDRAMRGSPVGAYPRLLGSLQTIANRMARDVKDRINANQHRNPLAQSTIARKGHDVAWIESGHLYDSIEGVVRVRAEFSDGSARPGAARFRDALGRFTRIL